MRYFSAVSELVTQGKQLGAPAGAYDEVPPGVYDVFVGIQHA